MANLVYLFLGLVLIKFLLNALKLIQCQRYLSKYSRWLKNQDWGLVEQRSHVIKVLKDAGVQDNFVPVAEPMVYTQDSVHIATANVSVFNAFPTPRDELVGMTLRMFHEAVGVYRARMVEALNPFYWIQFVVTLPKRALSYLGVAPESVVIKVFQLIYWMVVAVFGFTYTVYKPEIDQLVRHWLSNLTP